MGILISYEGRERSFWYPCADKRLAVEIIGQHCHNHPADDRAKTRAAWVTRWEHDKPVDAEAIPF